MRIQAASFNFEMTPYSLKNDLTHFVVPRQADNSAILKIPPLLVYTAENLKVRRRTRKRYATVIRCPMENASKPNESWSMDFTSDSLYTGRRFRTLNVIDEFSRESLGIAVAFSIRSKRVTCLLDKLIKQFGKPASIKVDNGPEFRSGHTQEWAQKAGIELNFIEPGKPMQNAFIESFNGRFRDECLNENWFSNIWEAVVNGDQ